MAVEPGLERAPGLASLQDTLRALPDRKALRRQCDIVTLTNQRRETADGRGERLLHIFIREAEGILGHQERRGQRDGQGASEPNLANTRQRRGIAREPTAGITAWGLHGNAGEIDPPMRRPDAVKAATARRYAHRAARIGAKGEIAGLGGDGRGRST